jgi:glycosyltransferase involved in cell wall biosynthesis
MLPSGKPWPRISIVTATRNQGEYIEETILSVLNQGYPNVERIIIDGASTDETSSILERYRGKLALVIRESDDGQSHAINKGMSKTTG